ncbi:hypothetical protein CAter282_3778 [Collimonas arenae]|uniref:Uncharacterized protein n=1 Tax=Collimonas arenae TaxID=279058 RepID=A0A127QN99_9BURK|nr:hypothetical protein CAter10_4126 [Collimonas arenae]AMP11456.1 hypothetical protein CAter282_3778 [Collimonas arenae]
MIPFLSGGFWPNCVIPESQVSAAHSTDECITIFFSSRQ